VAATVESPTQSLKFGMSGFEGIDERVKIINVLNCVNPELHKIREFTRYHLKIGYTVEWNIRAEGTECGMFGVGN
jgi:hypothetical protein